MLGRDKVKALEHEIKSMVDELREEQVRRYAARQDEARAWLEVERLKGKLDEAAQELADARDYGSRCLKTAQDIGRKNERLEAELSILKRERESKSWFRPSAWPDSAKAAFVWAWFVLGILALVAGILGVVILAGGPMFAEHQGTAAALRGIGFAAVYGAVTYILVKRYG